MTYAADAATIEAIREFNRLQARARRAYYAAMPHEPDCPCAGCLHAAHNRASYARKLARQSEASDA